MEKLIFLLTFKRRNFSNHLNSWQSWNKITKSSNQRFPSLRTLRRPNNWNQSCWIQL
uniref:Uncharacterized protein n=1 Tax=Octopus bimaculoides TaxID=37653 RepID=A0A0L8IAJ4_OCTBM